MAIQSEVFSTSFGVRTFASTKPIATKQHMAVLLKRVSDNVWIQASVNSFELINNSAVLEEAPNQATYSQIEIRVADEPNELGSSKSDIAIVASLATSIEQVVSDVLPHLPEILLADDNASIATQKASEASVSANASEVSRLASESARDLSLTYSQNSVAFATASSDSALASANSAISASDSATTATTQAGIATTKAGEASTSASQALGYRNEAKVFRDEAEACALSIDSANLVHKTGDETITGVKTFSSSPIAPTPTLADNSTKVATTAFVLENAPTIAAASETVAGKVELATNAEVQAGTDTVRAVTPSGLYNALLTLAQKAGFAVSLGSNGYIKFPSWLGGIIFQWGTTSNVNLSSSLTVTMPLTFPTSCLNVIATRNGVYVAGVTESAWSVEIVNTSQIKIGKGQNSGGTGTATPFFYLAIGY